MFKIKSLLRVSKKKSPSTTPLSSSSPKIRNVKKLAGNAFTFESTYNGGSRITIAAHSSKNHPGLLKVGDQWWDADTVINKIKPQNYDQVRVLACMSDEIGAENFLKDGENG